MEIITRSDAIARIRKIVGVDLRPLAQKYNVTVFKQGKLNKGWAGHVLEQYLGLGLSSKQAPNGETWELKSVPLYRKEDFFVPKETMAITMINAENVLSKEFEESHLYFKLRSLVICGRLFESKKEEHSKLISVGSFDLLDKDDWQQVKADYDLVRETLRTKGFNALTGKMGVLVQPRTKGAGHGSESRAFYARTGFVKKILKID